jgi:hypothetical protein
MVGGPEEIEDPRFLEMEFPENPLYSISESSVAVDHAGVVIMGIQFPKPIMTQSPPIWMTVG